MKQILELNFITEFWDGFLGLRTDDWLFIADNWYLNNWCIINWWLKPTETVVNCASFYLVNCIINHSDVMNRPWVYTETVYYATIGNDYFRTMIVDNVLPKISWLKWLKMATESELLLFVKTSSSDVFPCFFRVQLSLMTIFYVYF